MSSKQTTVLILGIALIAMQFYAGGQWKILFGIIKAAPATKKGGGSNTNPPPGRGVKPSPSTPNPHGFVQ